VGASGEPPLFDPLHEEKRIAAVITIHAVVALLLFAHFMSLFLPVPRRAIRIPMS
jgi:hypothetical protein